MILFVDSQKNIEYHHLYFNSAATTGLDFQMLGFPRPQLNTRSLFRDSGAVETYSMCKLQSENAGLMWMEGQNWEEYRFVFRFSWLSGHVPLTFTQKETACVCQQENYRKINLVKRKVRVSFM